MDFIDVIEKNANGVIAVSTIAYTLLTAMLSFFAWRGNVATHRLIKYSSGPTLIAELRDEGAVPVLVLHNASRNAAYCVRVKCLGTRAKLNKISSDEDRRVTNINKEILRKSSVKIKLYYKNDLGSRYKKVFQVEVPPTLKLG